ncbi:MAG TPA: hypothetical protein VK964_04775 [Nocardioidaceae bacterium]|nr:hypothetical protein [Nocardioidaceae bacterium]
MSTRVYLPSSITGLNEILLSGGVGPVPLPAHAVTDDVRAALPDAAGEEWEYAVLNAAAQDSVGLLTEDDPPRRVVVVAEVGSVTPGPDGSLVEVDEVVSLRQVVAVHVDGDDAAEVVAAARAAWSDAEAGDEAAVAVVERCLDHELGWFATQEIGVLLES